MDNKIRNVLILSEFKVCFDVSSCDYEFKYTFCRITDTKAGESKDKYEVETAERDSENIEGDDFKIVVENTNMIQRDNRYR